ncbi:uncharacterized protein B0H64DRAFT_379927 [Chaetomium fimeti]|uniref:Uncharacterized protein n=1 Tax=Chaetomium fimeti TaxID=1854472 RepID=A0AAE0HPC0_9PEZI|nr:hypothetical protein B0H64DRAFT_379927 [Chaetomium fimeti]
MVQNNSSVSDIGTDRLRTAKHKRQAVLSRTSTLQLSSEQHRQVLRRSTSLEINSRLLFLGKSPAFSLSQPPSPGLPLSSSHRKTKSNQLAHPPILHRHLSRPPAPSKLAKLYRRHRNLERAVSLFLLRRQWWRRTRRPTLNSDFIKHLRQIQADEPSSDEESGRILASAAVSAHRRSPSTTKPATTTTPAQPGETEVAPAKRKRDGPAEAAPESTNLGAPAKPGRVQSPSPLANGKPSPVANGTTSPRKRARANEEASPGPREGVHKRAKTETPLPPKPKPEAASSKTTAATAAAAAAVPPRKPVDKMEYFERRVHDMLTNPLEFDDCVHDSTRPPPRHAARSFAKYRRRQTQAPPPLVMSGALGPAAPASSTLVAKPAVVVARSKGSGNALATEAQKRAHQRKGGEWAQGSKGKGKAVTSPGPHGKAVGRQPVVSRSDGGRRGERRWLSNARQTGVNGGQRHPAGVKKYNKFA